MSFSSGLPTTPNSSHMRSGLPTPSGSLRRTSLATSAVSPVDSPDIVFKKQTLAEAISRNDPAKYRLSGTSPSAAAVPTSPQKGGNGTDSESPLLTAGKLPRTSLLSRKSNIALRSHTPSGRLTPASYTPPSSHGRLDVSPNSYPDTARSKSPLVPSGAFASVSSSSSAAAAARAFSTPKRLSDLHSRASLVSTVGRTPSHSSTTVASRARQASTTTRRGRELEIGDVVSMEGSDLVGVLRHLGPVTFKPGFYAGLELTGDSVGKGKNDGSVQGTQYFACAPGNGVFCPASKVVAINDQPPCDAVARPASSLSSRPGSRASELSDRHSAITPARRRASTISRPPSTTPSRASSRASSRVASGTDGGRPASALSSSRPTSRLAARKSLASTATRGTDHEDGAQCRADPVKSSLYSASASVSRTPRSSTAPTSSAAAAAAAASQATPMLAKKRQSLGGIPTPRATKGRASMFARPTGLGTIDSSMPPPPSPTKDGRVGERSVSSLSFRSSSRLGREQGDIESSPVTSAPNNNVSTDVIMERNMLLLEQMDLTPKKAAAQALRAESRASAAGTVAAGVVTGDDELTRDSVAEAVVPLSLYEEQVAEFDRLRTQLDALEKQNLELQRAQEARKARTSEVRSNQAILEEERVKMRAEARERQSEMEEERRLEREDEVRRRKEIEERERELKEKLHESQTLLSRANDEQDKLRSDFDSQKRGLQAKVDESERLIAEMKKRIEEHAEDRQSSEMDLKDAEIESLRSSVTRLEEESQKERLVLSQQIDELKEAGRETISLYEQRIEEIDREKAGLLDDMELLAAKAQEAIRTAESKYEDLLQQQEQRGGTGGGATAGLGGAAEIDNEALREQVAHLQDKLGKYEDQIAEATMVLEKEKDYSQKRREKSLEVEASLKNEIKRLRAEVERLTRLDRENRQSLDELQRALKESQSALEQERAELEGLRADVENIESLEGGSGGGVGGSRTAATASRKQWQSEKAEMQSEIDALRAALRLRESDSGDKAPVEVHADSTLEKPSVEQQQQQQNRTPRRTSQRLSVNSIGALSEASADSTSSANQVSGLSYLVRQLTDDNNDTKARYKLLESEMKERLQEAETKARTLEITVESLRAQLGASSSESGGAAAAAGETSDQSALAAKLADSEARLRLADEQVATLQLSLAEAGREQRKVASSLQKEVSELEALVEARIFREDELMTEIDRLKRKLDRHDVSRPAISSNGTSETSASASVPASHESQAGLAEDDEELNFCGLCSNSGHSLEECTVPHESQPLSKAASKTAISGITDGREPCDDCGEVGHRFEDCPYAAEMF
ncbi:hypothetical protein BCV70DRAFT_162362 [Testicularia cyperi]|uniref:CAP-Gly domain-containing protein n=1 Tax=Testicularia cyperi TaxID=1882483 RepID=A0A317XNG8_9BASI|nr:hypothetical protein BCV70DRAFT_162362 [Testicularia cyperi]